MSAGHAEEARPADAGVTCPVLPKRTQKIDGVLSFLKHFPRSVRPADRASGVEPERENSPASPSLSPASSVNASRGFLLSELYQWKGQSICDRMWPVVVSVPWCVLGPLSLTRGGRGTQALRPPDGGTGRSAPSWPRVCTSWKAEPPAPGTLILAPSGMRAGQPDAEAMGQRRCVECWRRET